MTAHPLLLYLPGGIVAPLIPGTRPPRYEGWDGSIEIPEDLADTWHWHGSFLSDGRVVLFSGDYGFPGIWHAARRGRVVQLGLWEVAA